MIKNYVGRASYEEAVQNEKNTFKQSDADRAIRLLDEYDIPITAKQEETSNGTIYGPFPDGSFIFSFTHNGEQNMFSASSKDKINQLFQDITFASVEDRVIEKIDKKRVIEKIDKKKESTPNAHLMLKSWENNLRLYSLTKASILKALSGCLFNIDHLMENITNHVDPNKSNTLLAVIKKLQEVGNDIRNAKNSPNKEKISKKQYSTNDGYTVVVNYLPKDDALKVSTILSPKEVFISNDDDGPYTPEFLDLIQRGDLGINACPICLGSGCKACQNGITELSPDQEEYLLSFINKKCPACGSPAHPATGFQLSKNFLLCGSCAKDFQKFLRQRFIMQNKNKNSSSWNENAAKSIIGDKTASLNYPKGQYWIKEWDDSMDTVFITPILSEDGFAGYKITYKDGVSNEVSSDYLDSLIVGPVREVEAKSIRFNPDYPTATSNEGNEIFSSNEHIIYKDISPLFKNMSQQDAKHVLHRLLKDPKNRSSNIIIPFIAAVKRIIKEKSSQFADDQNTPWLQAFSQLESMSHNFKKLQKISWSISDDKFNHLFQELLPLFVNYSMTIINSSQDLLLNNSISQPMVDSANKIISELSIIFNIEV